MKKTLIMILKFFLKLIYFFFKLLPTNNKKVVFISRQADEVTLDFQMISDKLIEEDPNIKIVFICNRIKNSLSGYVKYFFVFLNIQKCCHFWIGNEIGETKKSGKNEIDYIYSCGTRMMADFVKALEKGAKEANIPTPQLHMYGLERVRATHGICRFTDVYPALIKSAQPSLYVGGHPEVVHQKIRENRKLMNSTDIMPWLSTGCYGEYDSCLVEPIVLEALMNGSCGILNYSFGYFDTPLDFYYHALAIKKLAPYEEILLNGKFIDIEGSNKKMFYSMVQKDDEMLLLVGNYFKEAPATMVTLPYSKAEVLDLNTQKSFTASREFKFNVEAGKFSLFYIRKK